jgi:hypothetical protein
MATLNPTIRELVIREVVALLAMLPGELRGLQDWRGVHRGRTGFDPEDLPAITILPGMESPTKKQFGKQTVAMDISVQALFPTALPAVAGSGPSEIGEAILGALILTVMAGADGLHALVDDIAYTSGGIAEYPADTEQVTIVEAVFSIIYRTAIGDPYNQ